MSLLVMCLTIYWFVMCQILVTQAKLSCPCQRLKNVMRCEGWKNIKERCPELQKSPDQRDVSDPITKIYVDGGESINDLDLDNVGELLDWDLSKVTELRVSNTSVSSLQISRLTNLEDLDVRDNKLITMSPITRSGIKTLRMSGNPWPCVLEQREDVRSWTYSRFGSNLTLDKGIWLSVFPGWMMPPKCCGSLNWIHQFGGTWIQPTVILSKLIHQN